MTGGDPSGELSWVLLYTKPRAEAWAELNLRRQGFATLLPLVRQRGDFGPLFPRYLFAGCPPQRPTDALGNTRGVLYVVRCGDRAARVPAEVIADVRARMDAHGVVSLDDVRRPDPLFAKAQRERVRTLQKLASAGFRVIAA